MSNRAQDWAYRQTVGSSSSKAVLALIANDVRDEPSTSKATGKIWPAMHAYRSIASTCEATELDRKTVMASLRRLEAAGFIAKAGTDGQTNQVTVYALAFTSPKNGIGTSPKIGTSTKNGTVPNFPRTGTKNGTRNHRSHRNHIEPCANRVSDWVNDQ